MKTVLLTVLLAFGGAQAFAGICSFNCNNPEFSSSKEANAEQAEMPDCHRTSQQSQDEKAPAESKCPLQACASYEASALVKDLSSNVISFDNFAVTNPFVELSFSSNSKYYKKVYFIEGIRTPKVALYLKFQNLKLPS